jgi:GNAT superfamily N-acetyltransferase
MNAQTLMRLQVRALFTHDSGGRLRLVNEPAGKDAPRFFLGRTPDGNEWRFRHDMDAVTVAALESLCAAVPVGMDAGVPISDIERFTAVLNCQAPVQRVWSGPAYRFSSIRARLSTDVVRITGSNSEALRPHLPEWLDAVESGRLLLALLEKGRAVSVCCSVRVTPEAHEAGVETAAEYRRRGWGKAIVSAWAEVVTDLGAIPLYSTSWDNPESQGLAASLGLIQFGSNLHFS